MEFINKDFKISDQNSWESYILVGKLDDFGIRFDLLACIRYYILVATNLFGGATNRGVRIYSMLTQWAVYFLTKQSRFHYSGIRLEFVIVFTSTQLGLFGRVDMVQTNHNQVLTQWRHMPMGQFHTNIFLIQITSTCFWASEVFKHWSSKSWLFWLSGWNIWKNLVN